MYDFQKIEKNSPKILDIGSKNWFYAKGEYEFFNLGYTLDLYIYSKLCYFREYIAVICTPGRFISKLGDRSNKDQEKDNELWLSVLDQIIEGFKLSIAGDLNEAEDRYKIVSARQLLAEYWDCLWF